MQYIQWGFSILMLLFVSIAIVRIYMEIANHVGEKLRIGKAIIHIWRKVNKKI